MVVNIPLLLMIRYSSHYATRRKSSACIASYHRTKRVHLAVDTYNTDRVCPFITGSCVDGLARATCLVCHMEFPSNGRPLQSVDWSGSAGSASVFSTINCYGPGILKLFLTKMDFNCM